MTRNKNKILTPLKLATVLCVVSEQPAFHPKGVFILLWFTLKGEREKVDNEKK